MHLAIADKQRDVCTIIAWYSMRFRLASRSMTSGDIELLTIQRSTCHKLSSSVWERRCAAGLLRSGVIDLGLDDQHQLILNSVWNAESSPSQPPPPEQDGCW